MKLIILSVVLNEKGRNLCRKLGKCPESPLLYYNAEFLDLDVAVNEIYKQIGSDIVEEFFITATIPLPTPPLKTIEINDIVKVVEIGENKYKEIAIDRVRNIIENLVWLSNSYLRFYRDLGIAIIDNTTIQYLQKPSEKEIEEFIKNEKIIEARQKLSSYFLRQSNWDKLSGEDVLKVYEIVKEKIETD